MSEPRVVVVGGGFGGLHATRGLARASVKVTLIDKRNYHLFRPMLYQVATGLLSADQISAPLRSIVRRQPNVEVLQDEVIAIDSAHRLLQLKEHQLAYDFLILATGIRYNYFGHDDWRQFAPGLESLDDGFLIRGKMLTAFERAEETAALDGSNRQEIQRLLTFVLVGAGTVGVEMAATLAEVSRMSLARDFRNIDPRSARILMYEAAPRILPTFPESLSEKAQRHLKSLGVEVFTNTRVTGVDEAGIVADGKRVPAGTVLWGAGVLASPAGRWLGAALDHSGKIIVNADFSVPGHPEIFAIGDTAHVVAQSRNLLGIKSKQPMILPGVAQPAIQGGRYVAALIRRRVAGKRAPPPFWYWDKGDLAIVGRTYALADLRFIRFAGFPAWVVWAAVHIYSLIGFSNRVFVMMRWGLAFLTKRRQVRIFPGQEQESSMGRVQVEQQSYEMPPKDGFTVAHFLTVADVERSARFYERVFGGRILRRGDGSGAPRYIQIANTWLIVNVGGGPTPDKPSVTLSIPADADSFSSFMNIRVADIQACYDLWRSRGAQFITAPKDKRGETRCYIRDPDGYIIEIGQSKPDLAYG